MKALNAMKSNNANKLLELFTNINIGFFQFIYLKCGILFKSFWIVCVSQLDYVIILYILVCNDFFIISL